MSGLDYLHGIESQMVDDGSRPIRTAKAGVIGIIGTSGKGPVNKGVLLIGTPRKAVTTFGVHQQDGFTIPQALDGVFGYIGATVVVVNVCDPTKHVSSVQNELLRVGRAGTGATAKPYVSDVTFNTSGITAPLSLYKGQAALSADVTLVSVKSEDGAVTYPTDSYTVADGLLVAKEDGALHDVTATLLVTYSTSFTAGDVVVDADTGSVSLPLTKVLPNSLLKVNYTHVDPSKVTMSDIVGGVSAAGEYTGLHVFRTAKAELSVIPRILIAPHYTNKMASPVLKNPVVAEAEKILDSLRAVMYADAPDDSIDMAIRYRNMIDNKRVVTLYPSVLSLAPDSDSEYVAVPRSIHRAGLAAKVISEQGFHVTPSNYPLVGVSGVTKVVTGDGTDKGSEINFLNENAVASCLNEDGWREWGARTCANDAKWVFESVVRTADMIQESIQVAHLWAVDRNITKNLVGAIVNSVSAYLRTLKASGVILGGKCWADPELNTPESVEQGILVIDFDFTPSYPAEHIIFRAHMVNGYVTELFSTN